MKALKEEIREARVAGRTARGRTGRGRAANPQCSAGGRPARKGRNRQSGRTPLGRASRIRLCAARPLGPRPGPRHHGFRARREARRRPIYGAPGSGRPSLPRAFGVLSRHAYPRTWLYGGPASGDGQRRVALRHGTASQVRRRPLPHARGLLPDSDGGSAADESAPRRDSPCRQAAAPLHRRHALLPIGSRRRGPRYARNDPPASVRQSRDRHPDDSGGFLGRPATPDGPRGESVAAVGTPLPGRDPRDRGPRFRRGEDLRSGSLAARPERFQGNLVLFHVHRLPGETGADPLPPGRGRKTRVRPHLERLGSSDRPNSRCDSGELSEERRLRRSAGSAAKLLRGRRNPRARACSSSTFYVEEPEEPEPRTSDVADRTLHFARRGRHDGARPTRSSSSPAPRSCRGSGRVPPAREGEIPWSG